MTDTQITWTDIVDRQTGLLTERQNRILKKTRVLMLGLGGMGMNTAAQLVRAGFEHFTLMDCDTVDGTTANRTPFTFDDTVGAQKVDATVKYMKKINPDVCVEALPEMELDLDSDPDAMADLINNHDIASWAMDGMAGRIFYTRLTQKIGETISSGKPAVESWALPYHFVVWSFPNTKGSQTWEETLDLPSAGKPLHEITAELLRKTQYCLFQRFASVPFLWNGIDNDLKEKWLNLQIPNRSLGPMVAGCTCLISQQIILQALKLASEPLDDALIFEAPWMGLYDTRRHTAFEYQPVTGDMRWRHPVTNEINLVHLTR
jgi:hypothetical protein